MKASDMLSLLCSFVDFTGMVEKLKYTPTKFCEKKMLGMSRIDYDRWKVTATVVSDRRLNAVFLKYFNRSHTNYAILIDEVREVIFV